MRNPFTHILQIRTLRPYPSYEEPSFICIAGEIFIPIHHVRKLHPSTETCSRNTGGPVVGYVRASPIHMTTNNLHWPRDAISICQGNGKPRRASVQQWPFLPWRLRYNRSHSATLPAPQRAAWKCFSKLIALCKMLKTRPKFANEIRLIKRMMCIDYCFFQSYKFIL